MTPRGACWLPGKGPVEHLITVVVADVVVVLLAPGGDAVEAEQGRQDVPDSLLHLVQDLCGYTGGRSPE